MTRPSVLVNGRASPMASRRTPGKNPSPINHGLHCSNSPSNMRRSGQVVKNANTFTRHSPDNDIYRGQRKLVSISPGVCSASLSCRIESVVSLNLESVVFYRRNLGKLPGDGVGMSTEWHSNQ